MLNSTFAALYERDLRKLIDEVKLFGNEEDIWRAQGSVKNSAGNLVLYRRLKSSYRRYPRQNRLYP
jgi:hypothetical protein